MKRALSLFLVALFSVLCVHSQTVVIPLAKGEKWWGGMTALGPQMPLTKTGRISLATHSRNNQCVSMLVSTAGRFIRSERPFEFSMDGVNITIYDNPDVKVEVAGKTLHSAYLGAMKPFVTPGLSSPPAEFFSTPQYNTWIELNFNQNQADILAYAKAIKDNGLPAGVLMIDDTWQRYFGSYDFKSERFPSPKAMISELKSMGFKVMLWISPFISPDSQEFRDLEARGLLIKERSTGRGATVRWWNGVSAVYDLTNPKTVDYLYTKLKENQEKYGVDGFKFDGGDLNYYNPASQSYFDTTAVAADHTQAWAALALRFPYNELRACWNMQLQPLVQRLGDKNYSWEALNMLIPEMINLGLMGHPYACPDMIGGGQIGSFKDVQHQDFDQALIVRSAQLHALMPMMQFSVAPWRVLDSSHMGYIKDAVRVHQALSPYLLSLVKETARTGEPIVRSMEYVFPGKGFSNCGDQYMLGTKYIVAPILNSEGRRMVRLPSGRWVDDEGKVFRGPLVFEVVVGLGRIPVYESKSNR